MLDGKPNIPFAALDLRHREYPELAAALRATTAAIVKHWRALSVIEMPHLDRWTLEQFENDLRIILESMAVALESDHLLQIRSLIESAPRHGFERFLNEGNLLDLFTEERILRGVMVVAIEAELRRPMKTDEAASLHATVDVMIQQGVLAMVQSQKQQLREAEEARRSLAAFTEERQRAFIDQLPIGVGLMDAQGRWQITNPLMDRHVPNALPSTLPDQAAHWQAWDEKGNLIPPEQWPSTRALRGETVSDFEMRRTDDEGVERWMHVSAAPLRDASGQTVGATCAVQEITERKRAEAALRESEAVFRTLGESLPDFLWMSDGDGKPIYQNPAWRAYTGLTQKDLERGGWQQMPHPDDLPQLEKVWSKALRTGAPFVVEYRCRRHDGEYNWFLSRTVPVKDDGGRIVKWVGTTTDIHHRKQAEAALQESQSQLETELRRTDLLRDLAARLVTQESESAFYDEILTAAMAITESDGGTVQFYDTESCSLVLLVTRGMPRNMTDHFLRVNTASNTACGIALKTGERSVVDFDKNEADDACRMHVEAGFRSAQATPLLARDGSPIGMINTHWRTSGHRPSQDQLRFLDLLSRQAADLIEQRRAEASLRASEERYRQLFERIDEGFCIIEMMFDDASKPVDYRFIEVNPAFENHTGIANAKGRLMREIACDHEQYWFDTYGEIALTGRAQRFQAPAKAMNDRWYDVNAFRVGDPEQHRLAIIFNDITQRRRDEAALRESEQRLRLALAAAQMGTWSWRVKADIHHRDENLNRLLGLEPVESDVPIEQFFSHIHPDDRDRVRTAFDATVRQGYNLKIDFRVVWPDGQVRWLSDQGDIFGVGDERYLAGACVDITDRKQMEEALREADRRKNEFLATLAHELRNPLAPIRNSLNILRLGRNHDETTDRMHEMMDRQVNLMVRLVDDLLEVSRITRGKVELRKERVELSTVVRNAIETSRPLIDRAKHQLSIRLPTEPLILDADPVRLAQALANLLNNAAKYTHPGGQIHLDARCESDWVVITVRDNGIGIPSELLSKVFDLFMQADHASEHAQGGLGIGLTLVRSLVNKHGGSIDVHSEGTGKGSEFVVRLPLADGRPSTRQSQETPDKRPPTITSRRIVVVDDNRDAANSLGMLLKMMGAEIQTATDGPAALDAIQSFHPDVVLLDIGMPGMDGYEVARRARLLPEGRNFKLIALTGWGQEEDRRRTREAGFDHHLVKPVDLFALQKLL